MKNEIEAMITDITTTTAEAEDYTGEDGLLYCGKCHTPKEAYCNGNDHDGLILEHLSPEIDDLVCLLGAKPVVKLGIGGFQNCQNVSCFKPVHFSFPPQCR